MRESVPPGYGRVADGEPAVRELRRSASAPVMPDFSEDRPLPEPQERRESGSSEDSEEDVTGSGEGETDTGSTEETGSESDDDARSDSESTWQPSKEQMIVLEVKEMDLLDEVTVTRRHATQPKKPGFLPHETPDTTLNARPFTTQLHYEEPTFMVGTTSSIDKKERFDAEELTQFNEENRDREMPQLPENQREFVKKLFKKFYDMSPGGAVERAQLEEDYLRQVIEATSIAMRVPTVRMAVVESGAVHVYLALCRMEGVIDSNKVNSVNLLRRLEELVPIPTRDFIVQYDGVSTIVDLIVRGLCGDECPQDTLKFLTRLGNKCSNFYKDVRCGMWPTLSKPKTSCGEVKRAAKTLNKLLNSPINVSGNAAEDLFQLTFKFIDQEDNSEIQREGMDILSAVSKIRACRKPFMSLIISRYLYANSEGKQIVGARSMKHLFADPELSKWVSSAFGPYIAHKVAHHAGPISNGDVSIPSFNPDDEDITIFTAPLEGSPHSLFANSPLDDFFVGPKLNGTPSDSRQLPVPAAPSRKNSKESNSSRLSLPHINPNGNPKYSSFQFRMSTPVPKGSSQPNTPRQGSAGGSNSPRGSPGMDSESCGDDEGGPYMMNGTPVGEQMIERPRPHRSGSMSSLSLLRSVDDAPNRNCGSFKTTAKDAKLKLFQYFKKRESLQLMDDNPLEAKAIPAKSLVNSRPPAVRKTRARANRGKGSRVNRCDGAEDNSDANPADSSLEYAPSNGGSGEPSPNVRSNTARSDRGDIHVYAGGKDNDESGRMMTPGGVSGVGLAIGGSGKGSKVVPANIMTSASPTTSNAGSSSRVWRASFKSEVSGGVIPRSSGPPSNRSRAGSFSSPHGSAPVAVTDPEIILDNVNSALARPSPLGPRPRGGSRGGEEGVSATPQQPEQGGYSHESPGKVRLAKAMRDTVDARIAGKQRWSGSLLWL